MRPEEVDALILEAENREIEFAKYDWEKRNEKKSEKNNTRTKVILEDEEKYLGDNLLLELLKVARSDKLEIYIKQLYRKFQRKLSNYGITVQEYYDLLRSQNFQCAICKNELISDVIDHDHETGKVRGILCKTCNGGLIPFDEHEHKPWFTYRKITYKVGKRKPPSSPLREYRYWKDPLEWFFLGEFEREEYNSITDLKSRLSVLDKDGVEVSIDEQFTPGRGQMYGRYVWANEVGIVRIAKYLKGTLND